MIRIDQLKHLKDAGYSTVEIAGWKLSEEEADMLLAAFLIPKYIRWIDPNALDSYIEYFKELISRDGYEVAYAKFMPQACACVGPKYEDPLCPCAMRNKVLETYKP